MNLIKDYKLERRFYKFWIRKVRGIARVVEESVLSGIMKCLFIKQHLTFEELRAGFLNITEEKKKELTIPPNAVFPQNTINFEKFTNCIISLNFEKIKFYRYVGEEDNLIHEVNLQSVIEVNYSCQDLAIR